MLIECRVQIVQPVKKAKNLEAIKATKNANLCKKNFSNARHIRGTFFG
jgi:hypothetical protein